MDEITAEKSDDTTQKPREFKGALVMSNRKRYKDCTWRLDMELARRNVNIMTEPKFMIRLDVASAQDSALEQPKVESYHLQADFANLKMLQSKLQLALAELSAPHAQRLGRYIK